MSRRLVALLSLSDEISGEGRRCLRCHSNEGVIAGGDGGPPCFGSSPGTSTPCNQTGQYALLNWVTFNVGKSTTVNFQQGASNWVAHLNSPFQILGNGQLSEEQKNFLTADEKRKLQ